MLNDSDTCDGQLQQVKNKYQAVLASEARSENDLLSTYQKTLIDLQYSYKRLPPFALVQFYDQLIVSQIICHLGKCWWWFLWNEKFHQVSTRQRKQIGQYGVDLDVYLLDSSWTRCLKFPQLSTKFFLRKVRSGHYLWSFRGMNALQRRPYRNRPANHPLTKIFFLQLWKIHICRAFTRTTWKLPSRIRWNGIKYGPALYVATTGQSIQNPYPGA